jgi:hypothetical protein
MLPDFKFLICGVVFGLLLFAVTGVGVMLPDSYTRVGEMPEISRPMMQRMIAEEPQFYIGRTERRNEELERLWKRTSLEIASASAEAEPDVLKPTVSANPMSDGFLVEDMVGRGLSGKDLPGRDLPGKDLEGKDLSGDLEAPASERTGATGIRTETALGSVEVRPGEMGDHVGWRDIGPAQVAALPPPSRDGDLNEPAPRLVKVPLPPSRRIAAANVLHRRVLHRRYRAAQAPNGTIDQKPIGPPFLSARKQENETPQAP